MNLGPQSHATSAKPVEAGGLRLDDILFTLFRHKGLILAFVCLGIMGAATVRMLRPPLHVSEAKLMLHYVTDSRNAQSVNPETQRTTRTLDSSTQTIIDNEVQILTSLGGES